MITIFKGDNYSCELNYKDENNNPVSVAGFTFTFIVKDKKDCLNNDSNAIIKKVALLSGIESEQGVFYLNLETNETNKTPGSYICQFQLNNIATEEQITLLQGDFVIKNNIQKEV